MIEILQLSSYANDASTHGGKIRASEIAKCMEQLGFLVTRLDSKQLSYRDQVIPEAVKRLPDVLTGDFCELYRNYDLWRHVNSSTRIVIFEQPWLWNEIKQIKAARPEIIIIFSSHNLEIGRAHV